MAYKENKHISVNTTIPVSIMNMSMITTGYEKRLVRQNMIHIDIPQ